MSVDPLSTKLLGFRSDPIYLYQTFRFLVSGASPQGDQKLQKIKLEFGIGKSVASLYRKTRRMSTSNTDFPMTDFAIPIFQVFGIGKSVAPADPRTRFISTKCFGFWSDLIYLYQIFRSMVNDASPQGDERCGAREGASAQTAWVLAAWSPGCLVPWLPAWVGCLPPGLSASVGCLVSWALPA